MKRLCFALILFVISMASFSANAMYTEIGAAYGYKSQTYDENNKNQTESLTGSVSLYFWERIALELSYTDATAIVESKAFSTDPKRTTIQRSQILGADLIFVLADKTAFFQPYVKGGIAQINRTQKIKIEGQDTYENDPESAIAPSYGVGVKLSITDSFGIKLSYEAWKTPVGGGSQTDDSAFRAGISWTL
ncbi:MAG TPA: outer membrane beta-barrel protein [Bdellovibrio sp.]|uniref:outer membrane protein n=1 Tax=Bdellovibrio sp. TaxID=28201 RepID=UPI002EE8DD15